SPDAVVVIVTNPVDVVTYAALRILGLPANQVLGSGTVLDSSRLRSLLARHCEVAVQNVHAYIAGEHGDSKITLCSSATIGAVPVLRWNDPRLPPLTAAERGNIGREVKQAGYQILRGKGYTNYAVALASAASSRPTGCRRGASPRPAALRVGHQAVEELLQRSFHDGDDRRLAGEAPHGQRSLPVPDGERRDAGRACGRRGQPLIDRTSQG